MFEQTGVLTDELTRFLKGENKPTVVFEFSYQNIIFILVGLTLALVVSNLLVNALSK